MGYYSGTVFHRVAPGLLVQAAGSIGITGTLAPAGGRKRIAQRAAKHARHGCGGAHRRPDSARAQFFVNLEDNDSLDGSEREPGFTVFGPRQRRH